MAEVQATKTQETSQPTEQVVSAQSPSLLAGSKQEASPPAEQPSKEAGEAKATPTATVPAVPEKYEFTVPDGESITPEVMEAYSAAAKDLKMSQADAQKMLVAMAPALRANAATQHTKAVEAWSASSKADQEFGGTNLKENLGVAKQAVETFASQGLRTLLEESGLGNHPEVIRMFYRVGKSISQDRLVTGTRNVSAPSDPAKILYPNMA